MDYRIYEKLKRELQEQCLTPETYERAIKEMAEKLESDDPQTDN